MPKKTGKTGQEMSSYIDKDVAEAINKRAALLRRTTGWIISEICRPALGLPPIEIKS